jgi:ATP-dependent DNA helicase RecQ
LLGDESPAAVKMWIEQLISQDFLQRVGEYSTLAVTPAGRDLLKRIGNVSLTKPLVKRSGSSSRSTKAEDSWEGVDRGLFDRLRSLRSQLASERRVPAYVIFGDAVLRELARQRPSQLAKLATIRGIGERKLEEFGQLFLDAIDAYAIENSIDRDVVGATSPGQLTDTPKQPNRKSRQPKSAKATLSQHEANEHFRVGKDVAEVAGIMGRAESTVAGYLISYLAEDKITDASCWVPQAKIPPIEAAIPASDDGRLKPIYDALNEQTSSSNAFTYDEIRIVIACAKNKIP